MSHLTHDLDKTSYKIGAVDVFMSFVENDKLIERLPFVANISKELKQNNELTVRPFLRRFRRNGPQPCIER